MPECVPTRPTGLAHGQQVAHTALVARPSRPHALAHPGFFCGETLVKLLSVGLLHRQKLLLLGAIGGPVADKTPQLAAV